MSDKRFQKKLQRIHKRGERRRQIAELEQAYAQYAPMKKKFKVSNIVLVVVIIAIVVYTVANFWLMYHTGCAIDSTLTTCFYAFFGSELFLLAGIKTSKVLKGADSTNINTDDEAVG